MNIKKKINGDVYEFDDENHRHMLNGTDLVGVTTAIRTINPVTFSDDGEVSDKTGMLMAWAVKLGVGAFSLRTEEFNAAKTAKEKNQIIKECKAAWKSTRDGAGNKGSYVHEILDKLQSGEKPEIPECLRPRIEYAQKAITGYEVVRHEVHVWSKTHMFGGIADLLLRKDGKYYIADYKTSKSVHNEFFAQMAAYDIAMQELGGIKISGYIIIHLPEEGACSVVTNEMRGITTTEAREVFLAALKIYRLTYKWAGGKQ